MNLDELKDRRTEIIKAEIASLLFNLGKTHVGFWKNKNEDYFAEYDVSSFKNEYGYDTFGGYRDYYNLKGNSPFKIDLQNINSQLEKFFYETDVNLKFDEVKSLKLVDIIYGDAIKNDNKNINNFVKKIFFHGCENINSGIDKGTPPFKQKLQFPWIANAFGTYKEKVKVENLDRQRLCFFSRFWNKIDSMNRLPEDFIDDDWVELREFVFTEIKTWYRHLLSDSRYPVNDVTLWEQTYMTSSLFKATLAAISLNPTIYKDYLDKPRTIRWSIMGVQYDKLGLAEKSLKLPFVKWYREKTRTVDDTIKNLIEIEYALGNEIYRDETGIYFIVPENVGEEYSDDKESYILPLRDELNELKEDILKQFTEIFDGEVYPAIFVTKPTRGTMNLTYLLEKSRDNYLQASHPANIGSLFNDSASTKKDKFTDLCQVCGLRLGRKRKQRLVLCDVCSTQETNRLDEWLQKINEETIWSGDLQDAEGRIAFVTVKFELMEWLNGNMMNAFLNTHKDYQEYLSLMKNTLLTIRDVKKIGGDNIDNYKKYYRKPDELLAFISKVDSVIKKYKTNITIEDQYKIDYENKKYKGGGINGILSELDNYIKKFHLNYKIFKELSSEAYKISLENFLNETFLEFLVKTKWQDIIEEKIGEKIKRDKNSLRKEWMIEWDKLSDEDIDFLAEIFLQFLLRKNPSPARLRRIWETTEDFFLSLKKELKSMMKIEDWRFKRPVWKGIVKEENLRNKEYTYNGLDFWVDKEGNLYLISSIEKALTVISKDSISQVKEKIIASETDWIDKGIVLRDYETGEESSIKLNDKNMEYEPYLPYLSIIDPTPVSWQFIIPARYVPEIIEGIQESYRQNFKYVAGKLPLHIGVVIQDYKRPLYIGLQALRRIRRDIKDWQDIEKSADVKYLMNWSDETTSSSQEEVRNPLDDEKRIKDHYTLYPLDQKSGDSKKNKKNVVYTFYLEPHKGKEKLVVATAVKSDSKVKYYPNTFDFEYLDVNIRRNDVYYEKGQRFDWRKANRPYEWKDWENFKLFRDYFKSEDSADLNRKISKLNNIINLIYSKLQDWEKEEKSIKNYLLSAFINVFELNKGKKEDDIQENKNKFAKLLGEDKWNASDTADEFKKRLLTFIDMYEFWHKALKIIEGGKGNAQAD